MKMKGMILGIDTITSHSVLIACPVLDAADPIGYVDSIPIQTAIEMLLAAGVRVEAINVETLEVTPKNATLH